MTADLYPPFPRDFVLTKDVIKAQPLILHLHGLWRSHTRIANALNRAGLPIVISPHGMLDSWALANSRLKKRVAWLLWEERSLRSAKCLHALCPAEAEAIRELLPGKPIAVIPNGIQLPQSTTTNLNKNLPLNWSSRVKTGESVLLFLGRFHAKKGLNSLIEAWKSVSSLAASNGWWLGLVGYGDGGVLQRELSTAPVPRCFVCGPAFGDVKMAILRSASAFILPSYSEGLPMAALEAMSLELPCLLSSACNLPEAFLAGAALEAEPKIPLLIDSLKSLFLLSSHQKSSMGKSGYELVVSRYNWDKIARQTSELYSWILDQGEIPSFVQT